jgi:FixJ family two-component response regulator
MTTAGAWVVIVDDDAAVRDSLQNLLDAAGFRVAAMASPAGLIDDPRLHLSCCVVLDLRMPGVSGLDVQRQLDEAGLQVPVVFLSGQGNVPSTVAAMKGGAVDFLEKPVRPHELLDAVHRAIERGAVARAAQQRLASARRRLDSLSARERGVLAAVVAGRLNRQIAEDLGLTERTVKFHRANIMRKMRVSSVAELVTLTEQLRVASVLEAAKP